MLRRKLWWLLAVLVLIVAGCAGETGSSDNVAIDLAISPDPPQMGPAHIVVTLTDSDGAPMAGGTMQIEGTMTHPGMKPAFADAKEIEPGRYGADLEFTMGGDWIIIVRCVFEDGKSIEREIEVSGVKVR